LPLTSIATVLTCAALVVGLVFPVVLPEVGNVSYFVLAGLALLAFSWSAPWRELRVRPVVYLPLVAGALLTICFIITAEAPLDALAAVFFMPLFLIAPMVELFRRGARFVTPTSICLIAAAGCVGAFGVALYDSYVLGMVRAGFTVNNPIHFADIALTLGFVALVGLYTDRLLVRLAALCAPILGLIAVILSGSRGPLVASVPMALTALVVIVMHFRGRAAFLRTFAVAIAGVAILGIIAWQMGFLDASAFADALAAIGGSAVDHSTALRLKMYEGAYLAFFASPVFGHGLIGYVETANQFVPEVSFGGHLHSDLADFAVVGGIIGLLAYGLFLLAPLLEALRAPADAPTRRASVMLALVLVVGYIGMGLTNAMFGILTQTVLYAFCLALVAHLARNREAAD